MNKKKQNILICMPRHTYTRFRMSCTPELFNKLTVSDIKYHRIAQATIHSKHIMHKHDIVIEVPESIFPEIEKVITSNKIVTSLKYDVLYPKDLQHTLRYESTNMGIIENSEKTELAEHCTECKHHCTATYARYFQSFIPVHILNDKTRKYFTNMRFWLEHEALDAAQKLIQQCKKQNIR